MTINELVKAVREHAVNGHPTRFYRDFWDDVATWPDDRIADVVRFAHTKHGAIMAVAHHQRKELAHG